MSAMSETYECELRIGAEHPSLPGHFPNRPIVAGVVLLDQVLAAAERCSLKPVRVQALQHAKFATFLLPEETAQLTLTRVGDELKFRIQRAERLIAQGSFKLTAEAAA
jgi:3-hydroxymyristoyl/3-hydroxydecanoyl-(acyl carrier protein) dehydratase